MTDKHEVSDCCAVPLTELLRAIPKDARHIWTEPDGLKATHYVPIGRYAHEAADEIERLRALSRQPSAAPAVEGVCETCGGTRTIIPPVPSTAGSYAQPCPDCTGRAAGGEQK